MSQDKTRDSYWQQFIWAGEILFPPSDHTHELYLQVHTDSERYTAASEVELGLALSEPQGDRVYIHCKPCILEPRIMLTVALTGESDHSTWGRSVGEVVDSRVEGMDRRVIGNAQGWYYPADHILVLWECEVFYLYGTASEDPTEDNILITVWEAFERLLLNRFIETRQIITPVWEPKYRDNQWKTFLRGRGYTSIADDQRAFTKRL
jgi:hypothetical protein